MSSKNALDEAGPPAHVPSKIRARSLAARLIAWNVGSAFALVVAAMVSMYWTFIIGLDRKDDRLLGDRIRVLRSVLVNRPGDVAAIRYEVAEEWQARQRTEIHVRIMDDAGQVVTQTPGINPLLPLSAFPDPVAEPDVGTDFEPASGASFRVLAAQVTVGAPGPSRYIVQVAMERTLELQLLAEYRRNLFLVLGVALLVCSAVGYGVARQAIRPIHEITETARRISPANLSERLGLDGLPGEMLTLADTFNQMLERLEQSFGRLSRFSADIAHELRTPVHSLRGGVEVALSKPRSAEEYREVLGSSLEECGRLTHLIDRLLFLARAEHPETQVNRESCDVGHELATVAEFYGLAAGEAGVRLTVTVGKDVQANLDRPLFQRAVGNLVANSLAHTPRGGTVTLTAMADGLDTKVDVTDTGSGISATHLPSVCERFYRADSTRSSKNGSVGLGLAIVCSIMELHGGRVAIASEIGQGTRVSLVFPRKYWQNRMTKA